MEKIRKLTKVAQSSYAVVIPMDIIKKFGWKERQKLVVRSSRGKVIIEDWEAK